MAGIFFSLDYFIKELNPDIPCHGFIHLVFFRLLHNVNKILTKRFGLSISKFLLCHPGFTMFCFQIYVYQYWLITSYFYGLFVS